MVNVSMCFRVIQVGYCRSASVPMVNLESVAALTKHSLMKVEDGQCFKVLQGHANWVWVVLFHMDGQISGSHDQTVLILGC